MSSSDSSIAETAIVARLVSLEGNVLWKKLDFLHNGVFVFGLHDSKTGSSRSSIDRGPRPDAGQGLGSPSRRGSWTHTAAASGPTTCPKAVRPSSSRFP